MFHVLMFQIQVLGCEIQVRVGILCSELRVKVLEL